MTGRSAMRAAQGTRDANHSAVAGWYEELMCLTFDTHALGAGFPDLITGIPTRMGRVASLLNRYSMDGKTPDFVIADYLMECLRALDMAVIMRDHLCTKVTGEPITIRVSLPVDADSDAPAS